MVWKSFAMKLRLTSYFFGGRHPEEEFTAKFGNNFVWRGVVDNEKMEDGSFWRVPATDSLALPRDIRAIVEVTADGKPVHEEAKKLMNAQNAEARKAEKNIKDEYTIVYIPPYFKFRAIAIIILLWAFGTMAFGLVVALATLTGRSLFRLFSPHDVHDGYTALSGFYLIWVCYLSAKAIDRINMRRQRLSGDGRCPSLFMLVLKRGLLWAGKTAYMVFTLGIVIPILLAVVVELYMILPVRIAFAPHVVPRIGAMDEWVLGLLYAKIILHVHKTLLPAQLTCGLTNVCHYLAPFSLHTAS